MLWKLKDLDTDRIILLKDGYRIGRSEGDTTFPEQRNLSKLHCEFIIKNNIAYLKDLNSTNGCLVDMVRLIPDEQTLLKEGALISLGSKRFILICEGGEMSMAKEMSQPQIQKIGPKKLDFSFKGSNSEFATILIKNMIFTVLSLGFYIPYARTNLRKYLWSSTVLGSHAFQFTGKARELMKGYALLMGLFIGFLVVNALITAFIIKGNKTFELIQTLLVYGMAGVLFIKAKYGAYTYIAKHTSYRSIFLTVRKSGFKKYFKTTIQGYILNVFTLGLHYPFYFCNRERVLWSNTFYGSVPFKYTVNNGEFAKIFYKGLILSIFTLGLYFPWFTIDLYRYRIHNIKFQGASLETTATGGSFAFLMVKMILLVICTLGLAAPFVMTMSASYFLNNLSMKGTIDFDSIIQGTKNGKGAFSDSVADVFDLDVDIA